MVQFLISAILLTLPLLSLAIPHGFSEPPKILHPNTRMVALDEENNHMIAYDDNGRKLGIYSMNATLPQPRARGGQCFPMQNRDIDGIPKISELRKKADEKWGHKKRKEVVNDDEYPERPANVCADDAGARVTYDAEPSCRDITNEAAGHLDRGKVWLENRQGMSMTSSNTVIRSSKWGIGETISAQFNFPTVLTIGAEVSITSEFTNEQGEANTISQDSTTIQNVEQPIDEGQTNCKLSLTTTTCSIIGKASLKMVATGFLWFQYEDKVRLVNSDNNNGKHDKHYKWGMVIEEELPNIDDRSTIVEFKTNGDMYSESSFGSFDCTTATSPGAVSATAAAANIANTGSPAGAGPWAVSRTRAAAAAA